MIGLLQQLLLLNCVCVYMSSGNSNSNSKSNSNIYPPTNRFHRAAIVNKYSGNGRPPSVQLQLPAGFNPQSPPRQPMLYPFVVPANLKNFNPSTTTTAIYHYYHPPPYQQHHHHHQHQTKQQQQHRLHQFLPKTLNFSESNWQPITYLSDNLYHNFTPPTGNSPPALASPPPPTVVSSSLSYASIQWPPPPAASTDGIIYGNWKPKIIRQQSSLHSKKQHFKIRKPTNSLTATARSNSAFSPNNIYDNEFRETQHTRTVITRQHGGFLGEIRHKSTKSVGTGTGTTEPTPNTTINYNNNILNNVNKSNNNNITTSMNGTYESQIESLESHHNKLYKRQHYDQQQQQADEQEQELDENHATTEKQGQQQHKNEKETNIPEINQRNQNGETVTEMTTVSIKQELPNDDFSSNTRLTTNEVNVTNSNNSSNNNEVSNNFNGKNYSNNVDNILTNNSNINTMNNLNEINQTKLTDNHTPTNDLQTELVIEREMVETTLASELRGAENYNIPYKNDEESYRNSINISSRNKYLDTEIVTSDFSASGGTTRLKWPKDFMDTSLSTILAISSTVTHTTISYGRPDQPEHKQYQKEVPSLLTLHQLNIPESLWPKLPGNITKVGIPFETITNYTREPAMCVPLTIEMRNDSNQVHPVIYRERVYCFPSTINETGSYGANENLNNDDYIDIITATTFATGSERASTISLSTSVKSVEGEREAVQHPLHGNGIEKVPQTDDREKNEQSSDTSKASILASDGILFQLKTTIFSICWLILILRS